MAIKILLPSAIGLLSLCAVIALKTNFGESTQEPSEQAPLAKSATIQKLVQQLGDQKYKLRQEATQELFLIGEPAIDALLIAAQNRDDAEIRWRARQLIHSILMQSKKTAMPLVFIAAGEFQMGSPEEESTRRADENEHRVRITEPFLLGKREVTQREYLQVMKYNPSRFKKVQRGSARAAEEDPAHFPVESVSWFDAIEFCNRLSSLDQFSPYYRLSKVQREGDSIKNATVEVLGGRGYRLPTEAEWEFACRAGSKTRFYFGNTNTGRESNVKPEMTTGGYGGAAPKWRDFARPTEVGSYPTNAWGLADMHGNVGEWCWDWYDKDYYAASPVENPLGPSTGTARVQRGGNWLMQEYHARSASRTPAAPQEGKEFAGFRVARTPEWKFDAKPYLPHQDQR